MSNKDNDEKDFAYLFIENLLKGEIMKKVTKETIREVLKINGWKEDAYGHMKKDDRRVKFQKTSLRWERSYKDGSNNNKWLSIDSDYYKNIKIEDNKVYIKRKEVR